MEIRLLLLALCPESLSTLCESESKKFLIRTWDPFCEVPFVCQSYGFYRDLTNSGLPLEFTKMITDWRWGLAHGKGTKTKQTCIEHVVSAGYCVMCLYIFIFLSQLLQGKPRTSIFGQIKKLHSQILRNWFKAIHLIRGKVGIQTHLNPDSKHF